MREIMAAGICGALLAAAGCEDTVRLTNGVGESGFLLDGTINNAHVNDQRFTGAPGSKIPVGPVLPSLAPQSNELIAYTRNRPPTLMPKVPWTAGGDSIDLAFPNKLNMVFSVWIVNFPPGGSLLAQKQVAINGEIRTSQILTDERMGTGFSSFTPKDATTNANAPYYYHFNCAKAVTIPSQIGFDANAVNVYYVGTVDFGSGPADTNGVYCGGGVLALGANASDHLFTHEVGHFFALRHVDSLTSFFDTTNVMHSASNDRQFLTEGQTFRAIVIPSSAINWAPFNLRPGLTTRNCFDNTTDDDDACPALQKRIWKDGETWPPN